MAGAACLVTLAVAGAALSLRHNGSSATAVSVAGSDAKRFYSDVKTSLAPLLAHVTALPSALEQARMQPVSPETAIVARRWAEDAATARDLVGRLSPAGGPSGLPARQVYEFAAMAFGESARTLERLAGAPDAVRVQAATSGRRLHLVADRLFDQAKRLVDLHGGLGLDATVTLPAEVPDFEKEGLDLQGRAPSPPPGSGFADPDPDTVPASEWAAEHRPILADALGVLERTARFDRIPSGAAGALMGWSAELQETSRRLAGPVPDPRPARQASFLLRLSLLVESEALAVLSTVTASDEPAFAQAERLRLMGDGLWSLATDLFETGEGDHLAQDPPETGIDPGVLRQGGRFDGRPPPLAPGDPPDAGVPGGLRLPDPNQVFSNR